MITGKHAMIVGVVALMVAVLGVIGIIQATGDALEDDHIFLGSTNDIAVQEIIPDCDTTTSHKLQYDQATNTLGCDSTAPGSSVTTQEDNADDQATSQIDYTNGLDRTFAAGEAVLNVVITKATNPVALTDDNTWIGSATADAAEEAFPDCDDSGGNHLNYDTTTNALSCGTSSSGSGGGDEIEVEDGDNLGTFTAVDTTAQFEDSADINFTHVDGGAGGPDQVTGTVRANAVALGTDTTGAYVATIADAGNSKITVVGSGSETAAVTLDVNGALVRSATQHVCASDADDQITCDIVSNGTDDNVDIVAAITALPATGGSVSLSDGTFNVSVITIAKDNVLIQGQGESTIVRLQNTENVDVFEGTSRSNVTIRDLKIDGNKINNLSGLGRGIDFAAAGTTNITIERVWVLNTSDRGIRLADSIHSRILNSIIQGTQAEGIVFEESASTFQYGLIQGNTLLDTGVDDSIHALRVVGNGVVVDSNTIDTSGAFGISISASTTAGDGNIVSNNFVKDTVLEGINVEDGDHNLIVGNHVRSTGTDYGISIFENVTTADYNEVSNNVIFQSNKSGIVLDGSDLGIVSNNIIIDPNVADTALGGQGSGIGLFSSANDNIIEGNQITDVQNKMNFGVDEQSGNGNRLLNNTVSGGVTLLGDYNITGGNTTVFGYDTTTLRTYDNIDFNDGVTDSPRATFSPATGSVWDLYVEDTGDDLQVEVTTASTETVDFINTGAGTVAVSVDSLATGGTAECIEADTNGVLGLTGAGCDTVTLVSDPGGTTATTSSESGLELVGGALSMLRGCSNGQIEKWTSATESWDCSADSTGGTPSFDNITTGANTTATMTVGSGANLVLAVGGHIESSQSLNSGNNDTGATLFECTAVFISAFDIPSDLPEFAIADADLAANMPAIGLMHTDVTNGSDGFAIMEGQIDGLDTTTAEVWAVGDTVYINDSGTSIDSDCGNTLTNVRPTNTDDLIQAIAIVERVHPTNGRLKVIGAGRPNGLPVLDANATWIGSTTNVATVTTVPDCDDTGGNHLNFDQTAKTFSCGTTDSGVVAFSGITTGTNTTATMTVGSGASIMLGDGGINEASLMLNNVNNDSGVTLFECTAVYISAFDAPSDLPEILIADADNSAAMPAVGLMYADVTNGSNGFVAVTGQLDGLDTATGESWVVGNMLYINDSGTSASSDCGNTLTNVRPANSDDFIQSVATVERVHATNGRLKILGASRVNDVPNIADDNTWVGSTTNVATATAITDCDDAGSQVFTYDTATNAFGCGSWGNNNISYTAEFDAGSATSFEVPNGAGGTAVNAAGEVTVDTTSDSFNFYDGTVEAVLNPIKCGGITVEDPISTEDISMTFTPFAVTITEMRAVLIGSATPSVTWTVRHGTDRSAAGAQVVTGGTTTTSVTTGSDVTVFNDATIVLDSFVWLETTAQSGTVTELHVTICFRQDA